MIRTFSGPTWAVNRLLAMEILSLSDVRSVLPKSGDVIFTSNTPGDMLQALSGCKEILEVLDVESVEV